MWKIQGNPKFSFTVKETYIYVDILSVTNRNPIQNVPYFLKSNLVENMSLTNGPSHLSAWKRSTDIQEQLSYFQPIEQNPDTIVLDGLQHVDIHGDRNKHPLHCIQEEIVMDGNY